MREGKDGGREEEELLVMTGGGVKGDCEAVGAKGPRQRKAGQREADGV